jgi:hypothetical protein
MSPFMSRDVAVEQMASVRREVAGSRKPKNQLVEGRVTVRRFEHADVDGIRRLAELDSKSIPAGPVVVADVAGELVAALSLDGGAVLADPFRTTAPIVELLRRRAAQLEAERPSLRDRLLAGLRPRGLSTS